MPSGTYRARPLWQRREILGALASSPFLTAAGLAPQQMPAAAGSAPQQILAAADRARNGGKPFTVQNTLLEYRGDVLASTVVLNIHAKLDPNTGQFRNLIRYVSPSADAGKIILMDGQVMWFYDPATGATIRISPQQRLTGQASNGDALTVNLAEDYQAQSATRETVVNADRVECACWLLNMVAANDRAVYARLEHWVDAQTSMPVKTKYYVDSGRLLKIAYYRTYESVLGGTRPMEVIILDQVDARLATKMRFADFQAADIPDAWFQRDYLPYVGSR